MDTKRFWLMAGLHFVGMYVIMYAMVDRPDNIFPNLNNVYMAAMMTAPMLLLEPVLMGKMWENKNTLRAAGILGAAFLIGGFLLIRQQTFIYDREFIRSMIPHHSGAILMCNKAPLKDGELRELCRGIIASQQEEIDQMKNILRRLER